MSILRTKQANFQMCLLLTCSLQTPVVETKTDQLPDRGTSVASANQFISGACMIGNVCLYHIFDAGKAI